VISAAFFISPARKKQSCLFSKYLGSGDMLSSAVSVPEGQFDGQEYKPYREQTAEM
jgi:hypothetical protein